MSLFGPLETPNAVEKAVEKALRKWIPTYLKAVGAQNAMRLAPIKSFTVVSEYDKFPEQGHPAIVIESGGLDDEPEEDEEANLSGTYGVQVSIVNHGPEAVKTREVTLAYLTAIVAALVQHRRLSEKIWVKRYIDAAFTGANVDRRRTEVIAAASFLVTHEDFLNIGEGPAEPLPDEGDWPTVSVVETDVERKED